MHKQMMPAGFHILVTLAFRRTYLLSVISVVELCGTTGLRSDCITFVEALFWTDVLYLGFAVSQGDFPSVDEWVSHALHS